jgi:DnaJ-class molecular chaperone
MTAKDRKMNEDYEVLELEAKASKDKIITAYDRLSRVWDPANFGYSPRLQTEAEEQLTRIKQSYERLLKADSTLTDAG